MQFVYTVGALWGEADHKVGFHIAEVERDVFVTSPLLCHRRLQDIPLFCRSLNSSFLITLNYVLLLLFLVEAFDLKFPHTLCAYHYLRILMAAIFLSFLPSFKALYKYGRRSVVEQGEHVIGHSGTSFKGSGVGSAWGILLPKEPLFLSKDAITSDTWQRWHWHPVAATG